MTDESGHDDIKRDLKELSDAVHQLGKAVEQLIDGRVEPMTKQFVSKARDAARAIFTRHDG